MFPRNNQKCTFQGQGQKFKNLDKFLWIKNTLRDCPKKLE
jgi:hypothetical protein